MKKTIALIVTAVFIMTAEFAVGQSNNMNNQVLNGVLKAREQHRKQQAKEQQNKQQAQRQLQQKQQQVNSAVNQQNAQAARLQSTDYTQELMEQNSVKPEGVQSGAQGALKPKKVIYKSGYETQVEEISEDDTADAAVREGTGLKTDTDQGNSDSQSTVSSGVPFNENGGHYKPTYKNAKDFNKTETATSGTGAPSGSKKTAVASASDVPAWVETIISLKKRLGPPDKPAPQIPEGYLPLYTEGSILDANATYQYLMNNQDWADVKNLRLYCVDEHQDGRFVVKEGAPTSTNRCIFGAQQSTSKNIAKGVAGKAGAKPAKGTSKPSPTAGASRTKK